MSNVLENIGQQSSSANDELITKSKNNYDEILDDGVVDPDAIDGDFENEKCISTISTMNTDGGCGQHDLEKEQHSYGKSADKKDSKLAKELSLKLSSQIVFDEINLEWYCSENGIWVEITRNRALRIINLTLHELLPIGFSISKLNNMEAFLKLFLTLERWEVNKSFLPLKNGVLNVKKMTLEPYDADMRFRWQMSCEYKPDDKMVVIQQWLQDSTNSNNETIKIIRAFFNTALIGYGCQKFLEVVGAGGTGKSTLVRLLIKLIGEANHAATDLKNLEGNKFEVASLYGKRLAVISDSGRYGGEVSVLKAITGGDPVRIEKKNKQQMGSFVFDGAVIIASNEPVQSTDYTSGLARRRLPIMFNVKVTDADKERWQSAGGIEFAMSKELPALLNWVLSMPEREVRSIISGVSSEFSIAEREHLCATNKIAAWLDSNIILEENNIILSGSSVSGHADSDAIERQTKLYPNYEKWCIENKVNPIQPQRFTSNIIDLCDHIKLPVKKLKRSNKGVRIQGLNIRKDFHTHKTIITQQNLFSDDECCSSADSNTPRDPVSVHCADSVNDYTTPETEGFIVGDEVVF